MLAVWQLPEMELVQELGGVRNYNKAAISPDGNYMVCAVDHKNSTFLWTFDRQTCLFASEQEIPLFGICFFLSPLPIASLILNHHKTRPRSIPL